jgi:hypothetical protein
MRTPTLKAHYYEIDFLKAFSVLSVILIHVLDRYRSDPWIHVFWVALHFAVATFVIASGFLQQMKVPVISDVKSALSWLAARIPRFIRPYYIYVIIHALLILTFPVIFNRVDIEFTPKFIFDTIFLIGGFSQNWIPRLFVLMALIYIAYEFIRQQMKKSDTSMLVPFFLSLSVSILFLLCPGIVPTDIVKYVQTVTWLSLFFFGMLLFQQIQRKNFLLYAWSISGLLTFLLYYALIALGQRTSIFLHEYPPTLYFISYGIFITLGLFIAAQHILKNKTVATACTPALSFLSRQSYTLFFAHIIVMDCVEKPTGFWLTDYIVIAIVTIGTVYALEKIANHFRRPWIL